MQVLAKNPDELLAQTPYLIEGDADSKERFARVAERALATHQRAQIAAKQIATHANTLLGPMSRPCEANS